MFFYRLLILINIIVLSMPVLAETVDVSLQPATNENMQVNAPTQLQPSENRKLNINTATTKDLVKINGINTPKARAIVAYRKKHGDFKTLQDLVKVKGFKRINASNLQQIKNQLIID